LVDHPTDRKAEQPDRVPGETSVARPSMLRRWSREPLLHFLVIGFSLFIAYEWLHPSPATRSESKQIVLTPDDFAQLAVTWLAQGRAPPTPEQMRSLVELKVREEVLYREALALGLDKDDTIIKRRLAQKMEFLAEGASIHDPSTDTLRTWFKDNQQRFSRAPRVSFRHLYFSPDRRGEQARQAAAQAMAQLSGKPGDWNDAEGVGDPFMDQDYYSDRSLEDMAKLFGSNFARQVVDIKPGSWQGPIESGYGWHLVFVDSSSPSRIPAFEEIEPEIRSEWIDDQRAQSKRKTYEAMRARYQVVTPENAKN
jgi:peptidyl-prolyl cis-trans isomerase C